MKLSSVLIIILWVSAPLGISRDALQVPFVENRGQTHENAAFYARTLSGGLFVTNEGQIVTSLPYERGKSLAIYEKFLGALKILVKGEGQSKTKIRCFKGAKSLECACFDQVNLGEVYKNIRVQLKAYNNNVEKLFILAPGADPHSIRIGVQGITRLFKDQRGELVCSAPQGEVRFTKPVAYQEIKGRRIFVKAAYQVHELSYGFKLGAYNKSLPLYIDPLLSSTFLGAKGDDNGFDIAVGPSGAVYVSGNCSKAGFPTTPGAFDESFNQQPDAFISKFDPTLTTLLASTYMGGNGADFGWSLRIDSNGDVLLTGDTTSTDFPTTTGAFDTTHNGDADVFVAKLDANLSTLIACTFLGGNKADARPTISLDSSGDVIVAGHTDSRNIPTTSGVHGPAYHGGAPIFGGGGDLFAAKLSYDLSTLKACTYLGGTGCDIIRHMVVTSNNEIYLTGLTASQDFPITPGAFGPVFKGGSVFGGDLYVARMSNDLSSLLSSTFLSSSSDDWGIFVAEGPTGDIYVTGDTHGADFPTTPGAYDTSFCANGTPSDAFIARLPPDLTQLKACTLLGGDNAEWGSSILFDDNGDLYLSGTTQASNFPTTPGAYDVSYNGGDWDAYIAKFTPDLSALLISTYLGGKSFEWGDIEFDLDGDLYVMGTTGSNNFPTTPNAFDPTYNGKSTFWGGDVFVTRITSRLSASLHGDKNTISSKNGGVVNFVLDAGIKNKNRAYYMLGSMSGTSPGFPLPGQNVVMPLNWDLFLVNMITWINTPMFANFSGILDSQGLGGAVLTAGPTSGFIGQKLYFAYLLDNPFDFVSNPVTIGMGL